MIKKMRLEMRRQIFHILLGIILTLLLFYDILNEVSLLIIILIGIILSYISRNNNIPIIYELLETFERPEEISNFPGKGTIFYFIGSFAVLVLFPKEIALASIMVLALGDSISHLYGASMGKTKHPFSDSKYIEGTFAGFLAGLIGAVMFVTISEALVASLIAMTAESIEMRINGSQVDDNVLVPLTAAVSMVLLRFFF